MYKKEEKTTLFQLFSALYCSLTQGIKVPPGGCFLSLQGGISSFSGVSSHSCYIFNYVSNLCKTLTKITTSAVQACALIFGLPLRCVLELQNNPQHPTKETGMQIPFVVVYSKEITQIITIQNRPKRLDYIFYRNAHVVCGHVEVKLAKQFRGMKRPQFHK